MLQSGQREIRRLHLWRPMEITATVLRWNLTIMTSRIPIMVWISCA